jgi:hypothetical protein
LSLSLSLDLVSVLSLGSSSSSEIISTLLSDPTALPSHAPPAPPAPPPTLPTKKSSLDTTNAPPKRRAAALFVPNRGASTTVPERSVVPDFDEPDEDEFSSFVDAKATGSPLSFPPPLTPTPRPPSPLCLSAKSSVMDDTQHNTARRKIRWGDEVEGGALSLIKEFETLLPLASDLTNAATPVSAEGNEEDEVVSVRRFRPLSHTCSSLSLPLCLPLCCHGL